MSDERPLTYCLVLSEGEVFGSNYSVGLIDEMKRALGADYLVLITQDHSVCDSLIRYQRGSFQIRPDRDMLLPTKEKAKC